MFMIQISEGNQTHYAIFPESYLVVDNIFLYKTEHCAACRRVGPYLRNSLPKMAIVGFCAFGYKFHKAYFSKFLSEFLLFKIALYFRTLLRVPFSSIISLWRLGKASTNRQQRLHGKTSSFGPRCPN